MKPVPTIEFPKVKLKKPKYYLDLIHKEYEKGGSIETFYYTQLNQTSYFGDRKVFNSWLPEGIKRMDTWYCKRIKGLVDGEKRFYYTPEELENMILRNPYMHPVIKSNLIENLKVYGKNYKR